ncbi:MAG: DUF2273 domain-containing protein [Clostridia bacterium]|nr:DUF2273 domain-containing protein [Clostridia bacterium]
MKDFFQEHKWAVILSVLALIIVLLIYLIGWWTLLAVVLVAVAVFFGRMIDRGGLDAVREFFRNLFKGKHA